MFFVHIAGHVGKDPETRFTPSGQKVTTFSVAITQRKGKDKEEVTIWVRVTVWGDRFDKLLSFLKKGSAVIVGGRMNPPTVYNDKEGRSQVSLDVVAEMIEFSPFGGKSDRQGDRAFQGASGYSESPSQSPASSHYSQSLPYGAHSVGQGNESYSSDFDDDKIPF